MPGIQIENQEVLSVYVRGGTKDRLRVIGKRTGQSSMSSMVRKAILDYIEKQEVRSNGAGPE